MIKDIVAVVPVKANSDRVKAKNLRPFADTTLFDLKIHQLKNVQGFSKIIVSSEDEFVIEKSLQFGVEVHHRDPMYSTSDIPMSEVYSYIASEVSGENIAWVNVTNPLSGENIYSKAIEIYNKLESRYDCLLGVSEMKDYMFFRDNPVNFQRAPWAKSQDLEPLYSMNFAVNILKREDMVEWGSCVGFSPYMYVIDSIDGWDIDVQSDFNFCESVYLSRKE